MILAPPSRISADKVYVAIEPFEEAGEFCSYGCRVVKALEENVFKGDAPSGTLDISPASGNQFLQGVLAVQRNKLIAQAVVRGMERDGKPHL
jgi:hypothetical protein